MTMHAEDVVTRFVKAINRQDVEAICELMTDGHRFVDAGGQVFADNEAPRVIIEREKAGTSHD